MPSAIETNVVATVVPIGRHPSVFPAGCEARHCEFGWVLVEQARDNERLVRWYDFRDLPEAEFAGEVDAEGDPIIEAQDITEHRQWVSLIDLRRIAEPNWHRSANWQRLKRVGALRMPIEVIDRYVRQVTGGPEA
jgi:hypothetical protein